MECVIDWYDGKGQARSVGWRCRKWNFQSQGGLGLGRQEEECASDVSVGWNRKCRAKGLTERQLKCAQIPRSSSERICMRAKSLELCPTLCDSIDNSLPGFSVCGILQTRILQWVAVTSSRGFSWPRNPTCNSYVSCISRLVFFFFFFTTSTTWEAQKESTGYYFLYCLLFASFCSQHVPVNTLFSPFLV